MAPALSLNRAEPLASRQAVKPLRAKRLSWCGGKLIVERFSDRYYEFFDAGRFRRHSEEPPMTPSRAVQTLEFWVVDPATLRVDAGYHDYGNRLVCARDVPFAVCLDDDFSFNLLDLSSGRRLARYDVADFAAEFGWENVKDTSTIPKIHDIYVSANGQSLYLLVSRSGGTRIYRFDRREEKLTLAAESEPYDSQQYQIFTRLFVAPDESFASYLAKGKNLCSRWRGLYRHRDAEARRPSGGHVGAP